MRDHYNVVALREFYGSALGKWAQKQLVKELQRRWPELGDDTMAGIGYVNPVLRPFLRQERSDASLVFSMMPAEQGATVWPNYVASRAVLTDEFALPIADNHLNRLVMMHLLEHSTSTAQLLDDCWRVLRPGGRLLVVVPNARGLWARCGAQPFSKVRAYTSAALKEIVCEKFTHIETESVLYHLPYQRRWLMKLAPCLEWVGGFFLFPMGGVLVMEAEKQIYAGIKEKHKDFMKKPAFAPVGTKPALSRK